MAIIPFKDTEQNRGKSILPLVVRARDRNQHLNLEAFKIGHRIAVGVTDRKTPLVEPVV
jgi:hypothetical protein